MINPIKPNTGLWNVNIVRTVAGKSSNRLKFCWLKVICCIRQSNKLERETRHKIGGTKQGTAKNLGVPWPTQAPLRATTAWKHTKF